MRLYAFSLLRMTFPYKIWWGRHCGPRANVFAKRCKTAAKQDHSTSPSIYLNLQGLSVEDACRSTVFASTMLAFQPGELSTIVGQVVQKVSTSQQYNPADLSCLLEALWYELLGLEIVSANNSSFSLRTVISRFLACPTAHFLPFQKS